MGITPTSKIDDAIELIKGQVLGRVTSEVMIREAGKLSNQLAATVLGLDPTGALYGARGTAVPARILGSRCWQSKDACKPAASHHYCSFRRRRHQQQSATEEPTTEKQKSTTTTTTRRRQPRRPPPTPTAQQATSNRQQAKRSPPFCKKIRTRWRSRSTCRDSQTRQVAADTLIDAEAPTQRCPPRKACRSTANVGSVGAHHINIAVWLWIAGM